MKMTTNVLRWTHGASLLTLAALVLVSLSACSPGSEGGGDSNAPSDGVESPSDDRTENGEAGEEGSETDGEEAAPQGMISSGSAEPPPTLPPANPTREQELGVSRNVTASEARGLVPFTLYEPSELPDDSHRDVVRITEPIEGQDSTGLPGVRFIYTIESRSGFVLLQSPAGTQSIEGDSEAIDVAGSSGTLVDDGGRLDLAWELGETAFVLSSRDMDRDQLLVIATSLLPME